MHQDATQQEIAKLRQRVSELETELQHSKKNFRALTDSAPVGLYLDDADGRAIYINKKCAELVGVPAEAALNFNWISSLHPDDREPMVKAWEKAFKTSTAFCMEYRWVHADGRVVWTLGEVVPILGENGKATMFVGTLTDITVRKNAELEKAKLELELQQAQKLESIGRLAGGVAHDYNNILGAIICYSELALAEVGSKSKAHGMLLEILKAATRSTEITRQLLSFARKQIVQPKVFAVNSALEDTLNMLRRLIGEGIELSWKPGDPELLVKMDPSQLDQIIVNLCINARDALNGSGTVTLKTSAVECDDSFCAKHAGTSVGRFVLISVSDNGVGMSTEILCNIFEPFFTTKERNKGTGLGLACVYGAVKQSGGFISVDSAPGAGSTFNIYLPLHSGPRLKSEEPSTSITQKGGGETILIVEDEASILEAMKALLIDFGYQVLDANTPAQAIEAVRSYNKKIDLLITDVVLPEMNGCDLVNQVRKICPDLKCLYMSGYTADIIARQGILEEGVNFIQKPFRIQELVAKVNEVLHAGQSKG